MTIGIIGLGLIGGSLAKTIHRIHPDTAILACDVKEDALQQALQEGVITYGSKEITPDFAECSYLFLSLPVQSGLEYVKRLAEYLNESCILTDVGSTKTEIHGKIEELQLSRYFIGGHPMAGSEQSGYENATSYLLENAYYLITKGSGVRSQQVEAFTAFVSSLGCIPLVTTPEKHDKMVAAVSHLPHILAACLVNLVQKNDDEESMKTIAAGGFRDITRIASSSPRMWQEITISNRAPIGKLIQEFMADLSGVQQADKEEVYHFFTRAKDYRDSLPIRKSGTYLNVYELYCDLKDEVGQIAFVAALLAEHRINIKNIGILHNREFEEGVLRIEFYEEEAVGHAVLLLRKAEYKVYERK